jgi:hypothetical protein
VIIQVERSFAFLGIHFLVVARCFDPVMLSALLALHQLGTFLSLAGIGIRDRESFRMHY